MMLRPLFRMAMALIATRLAAKYVHSVPPKPENPSRYKSRPKEKVDFGKRGKKMPTAARRKPVAGGSRANQ